MKDRVLDTSIGLFGKKGFRETSIQDIVDTVGVTKGTFYYYFKNKEDVLVQIHQAFIEHLLSQQSMILEDETTSNKQKMYAIVEMLILNIRTESDSAMVFFREMRHLSEEKTKDILPKRTEFQVQLQRLIERGIDALEFRADLRSDMLSLAILGVANWSYFWYEPDGEVSEKELTKIYMSMIFEGIEEDKK